MAKRVTSILNRLGFTPEEFITATRAKAMTRSTAIAQVERLRAYAVYLKNLVRLVL